MSARNACTNVIRLEVWVVPQNGVRSFPVGEQAQDQLCGYAHIKNDGFAAKHFRANGNAFEQLFIGYALPPESWEGSL